MGSFLSFLLSCLPRRPLFCWRCDNFVPSSGTSEPIPIATVPVSDPVPVDESRTGDTIIDQYDLDDLLDHGFLRFDIQHTDAYIKRLRVLDNRRAREVTEQSLARLKRRRDAARRANYSITPSSGTGLIGVPGSEADHRENVKDYGGDDPDETPKFVPRAVPDTGLSELYSIQEFLKRPVTIFNGSIAENAFAYSSFDVWDLWSKQPSVRGKLLNYAYFTGDLHLRITINATPYHYGKLLFSYQPFSRENKVLDGMERFITLGGLTSQMLTEGFIATYLTQTECHALHSIGDNSPVVMHLPFISPHQSFRLYNTTSTQILDTTSFSDFINAGSLKMCSINPLTVANNESSDGAQIMIYAWAENIQLYGNTGTRMTITASSGVEDEAVGAAPTEYDSKGPAETAASNIHDVAASLTDVPMLGPYALATKWAAGAARDIFKMFGMSNPVVLDKPHMVKNNPYSNVANYEGNSTAFRITMDPKQELHLNSSIGGVCSEKDELAIATICSQYTFLFSTGWNVNDPPFVNLGSALVAPHSAFKLTNMDASGVSVLGNTRLALPASLFEYWRGSMTYKVEVICSKFHRGKLRLGFEPNVFQYPLIAPSSEMNTQNSVVMDIQNINCFEMTIEWVSNKAWLKTRVLDTQANNIVITKGLVDYSGTLDAVKATTMGVFFIEPLTELTSPNNAEAYINVYVKSDDMEFAVPRSTQGLPRRSYIGASSDAPLGGVCGEDVVVSNSEKSRKELYMSYMGESVVSLRSLLKRYDDAQISGTIGVTAGDQFNLTYADTAVVVGEGIGFASLTISTDLLGWVSACYMACRGSVRFIIRPGIDHKTFTGLDYATVTRTSDNQVASPVLSDSPGNTSNVGTFRGAGSVGYHLSSNGGVEFEIPYYSRNLFHFSFAENAGLFSPVGDDDDYISNDIPGYVFSMRAESTVTAPTAYIMRGRASGEDFNLIRFMGMSPYYFE